MSIIAAVCILGLFISELLIYLTPDRVDRLQVDTSRGEKLPIFVDVTFHSLPCQLLSLQAMDVAGSNQETLTHSFRKTPLDRSGRPLDQGHEYGASNSTITHTYCVYATCLAFFSVCIANECLNFESCSLILFVFLFYIGHF